jgi:hypothetical protein
MFFWSSFTEILSWGWWIECSSPLRIWAYDLFSPYSTFWRLLQTARMGDEFWKGIGQSPRNVEFEAGGSGEGGIGLDYTPCWISWNSLMSVKFKIQFQMIQEFRGLDEFCWDELPCLASDLTSPHRALPMKTRCHLSVCSVLFQFQVFQVVPVNCNFYVQIQIDIDDSSQAWDDLHHKSGLERNDQAQTDAKPRLATPTAFHSSTFSATATASNA